MSKLKIPTCSLDEIISTNKASYFLLNTSNSPFGLKCVQLNDKVYLLGATLNLVLNETSTISPFLNFPVAIFSINVLVPQTSSPLNSFYVIVKIGSFTSALNFIFDFNITSFALSIDCKYLPFSSNIP